MKYYRINAARLTSAVFVYFNDCKLIGNRFNYIDDSTTDDFKLLLIWTFSHNSNKRLRTGSPNQNAAAFAEFLFSIVNGNFNSIIVTGLFVFNCNI